MSEVLSNLHNSDYENIPKSSEVRIDVDLEDGPLFRATVKEYEGRTLVLKSYLKRILKSASSNLEAKTQVLEQEKNFIESLKEAPFSEPLFNHYLDFTWKKLYEQQERLLYCMQSLLIHPLQKLYDMDIKTVDTKKKQFEEVSKDYYTNLSKYLSIKNNKKQQKRTETEFMIKKREFDLVRFDYYTFLRDLHGGKKEQEILYHLLNLYQKQYSFFNDVHKTLEPHKQGLDELANIIAEASREQKIVNQERDEKRKMLVNNNNNNNNCSIELLLSNSINNNDDSTTTNSNNSIIGLGILENNNNKFKGIRDLDQSYKNTTDRRKEGFLFATSKPSKNINNNNNSSFDMSSTIHWHKYWCVLSGGQLHEYSNWKKQLESHIDPINLRFATVREARNSDRRFCFEIITPNFRRMYQATSNDELSSWISTINNAISSLLNGMSSSINLKETIPTPSSSISPTHWKARSLTGALSGLAAAKDKYLLKKKKPIVLNNNNNPQQPIQQQQQQQHVNTDLLTLLRKDLSNTICADCSTKNPDWCSLNLGILICIECSGIHRSLGTHISKVRSLTLDSASFTPDIIQLLLSIGNAKSNEIWESNPSLLKKPIPTDSRELKLKYIQYKYVDKLLVTKEEIEKPMNILYQSISKNDIPQALYAIALGANVNEGFTDKNIPMIPLLPMNDSVLKLPILDIEGNEYLDRRTMEIQSTTTNQKNFIVRYALHFALLLINNQEMEIEIDDSCSNSTRSSQQSSTSCSSQSSSLSLRRVFPMAEFLFQNGADVFIIDPFTGRLLADLIGLGNLVDNEAIHYLNMKNSLRGQSMIIRTPYI